MSSEIVFIFGIDMRPVTAKKKTQQVGFKVGPKLLNDLELASNEADRKRNEFARMLFELVFDAYLKIGDYGKLKTIMRRIIDGDVSDDMVSTALADKKMLERQVRTGGQVNEQEEGTARIPKTKSHRSKTA